MLTGLARKLSVPFVLLAFTGWIAFGVGFALRNVYYSEEESIEIDHAAQPDFFFQWLFGVSTPLVMIFTFLHAVWEHRASRLLMYIFLPFFLISAGGVTFFNGIQIYQFYQVENNNQVYLVCSTPQAASTVLNSTSSTATINNGQGLSALPAMINDDQLFVPIEFAGAVTAALFHWIFLLFTPFFMDKSSSYDDY